MTGRWMLGLLVVGLALVPATTSQDHEHLESTGVIIAHDLAPDGRTYVGNLNHFVVLYLGNDALPDFHQQNHVRVTLDNVIVYQTTPDSGHDYDGVYGFDVVFGRPGHFRVEAIQKEAVVARFEGTVHVRSGAELGAPNFTVAPVASAPGQVTPQGPPPVFTYGAIGPEGQLFAHSDAVLEIYQQPADVVVNGNTYVTQSGFLAVRVKTHTHNDIQKVTAALPTEAYTARASTYLSFPTAGTPEFQPASSAINFAVRNVNVPTALTPAAPGALGTNLVIKGTADAAFDLLGTYDPYNVVGPGTLQHLTAIVIDPVTRQTRQHVNFEATLIGPSGQILLHSDSLHEYDGILEIDTVQTQPGNYRLVVDAKSGNWTGHLELPYAVAIGVGTIGVGPQIVSFSHNEPDQITAGSPTTFKLRVADLANNPYQHGEIDVVIDRVDDNQAFDPHGVPVLRAKLHTHASGDFVFDYAFPEAGKYVLRASPYGLAMTATPTFWGTQVGGHLVFPIDVAASDGVASTEPTDSSSGSQNTPAAPLALVALGLLGAAGFGRKKQ